MITAWTHSRLDMRLRPMPGTTNMLQCSDATARLLVPSRYPQRHGAGKGGVVMSITIMLSLPRFDPALEDMFKTIRRFPDWCIMLSICC